MSQAVAQVGAKIRKMSGWDTELLPEQKLSDPAFQQSLHEQFIAARPYPHVCVDGLFDPEVLRRIVAEFPDSSGLGVKFDNARERKHATRHERELAPFTKAFIHGLNSASFIEFLEGVTGIESLIPDPHLVGGGLHSLPRGGKLAIHTDFNRHKRLKLDRRVNVLVYLNEDWKAEYHGEFEAWLPGGKTPEASYLPLFNRMVIFNTNDYTFHGNPEPVDCPEGMTRKSVAMYYYTNGRPADEWTGMYQTTRFMNRPGEAITESERMGVRLMRLMPKPVRRSLTNLAERAKASLRRSR
jgi:hypothetical protein